MLKTGFNPSGIMTALLLLASAGPHTSPAGNQALTPEALVARHLQSIGSPELLEKAQSRAFIGVTTVRFVQGATGELSGPCQYVSDGNRLGIVLSYPGIDYRGEHFAYDGKKISVGRFVTGKVSILGEFIERFDDLLKSGLMGGVLSVAWPLRNLEQTKPRLKYKKADLAGRPVHALEYRPGKGLRDFKIVLFFEPETYHHVRTEYKLHISAAIGGGMATETGIEKTDSHYLLSEEFAEFKEVDGMMLPQRYTIGFSSEGQTRTFVAYWTLRAERWAHNGQIDPRIFRAYD